MRTVVKIYNVYRFHELSDEAKEKVRHLYLQMQDACEFTSICESVLKYDLPKSELSVDYNLGYCQGDYCKLTGRLDLWDMYEKFKEDFTEKERRFLRCVINEFTSTYYFRDYPNDILEDIRDDLVVSGWKNVRWKTLEEFGEKATTYVEGICRDFMDDGYEFFYEVDDDILEDWCEANEYEFLENGEAA